MSESTSNTSTSDYLNTNALGTYLDGWADLAEGMGEKQPDVYKLVFQQLKDRHMPEVSLAFKKGHAGELDTSEKRPYIVAKTSPGAITTIYVGKHGDDLYISWRSFIKPVLNWMIGVIIFIALLVGSGAAQRVSNWFVTDFQVFLGAFIVALIVETGLVGLLGVYLKRDPFAFFFKKVTVLDAEDITAMNLSIHKTIFRALDNTGIDVSKLRIKEKFSGGRKGEDI